MSVKMSVAKRIKAATQSNPMWDLALEFVREGFDEAQLKPFFEEALTGDPHRLKIMNYMRDIRRGAKKPMDI
jgi:hypothetical protein